MLNKTKERSEPTIDNDDVERRPYLVEYYDTWERLIDISLEVKNSIEDVAFFVLGPASLVPASPTTENKKEVKEEGWLQTQNESLQTLISRLEAILATVIRLQLEGFTQQEVPEPTTHALK